MAIDSRMTIWTNPTTHSTGSTTNTGPTLDLFGGNVPLGGTYFGTSPLGVSVEIIQNGDSGTGQVTVWEFEISSDDSTWRKGGFIASLAMDSSDVTRKAKGRITTEYRYIRLLATNTGTGTSNSKAYVVDDIGPYSTGPSVA